ncbi:molybdate ABC transporter substrate-binding protein [Noviherbaspirillum cavernae]|uniref:Molybdate ABC transporter substrate-binding protein n=1 Tax=Noviherbaspirillum cavernae TaxID=2320862 RepID=A0A418X3B1_9BURK|nr:molybdate ABC transporter substrate-binding protein [Noviherbaspirillum cavernae]RJG06958.1 molybdate ABC transporter substrate-binding protein [Noviherbaspirillum cavernae]
MSRLISVFVALLLLSQQVLADTLTVAVAANVQYAFDDLQAEFKKETGHDIKPIYNSSGKFAAQILNGAPFDVFLSADMEYPDTLYKKGATATAPKIYAYGTLVLWSMNDIDLSNWQGTLADPAVKKIAIANPKTAPYGRETFKALAYYKLDETLKPKIVLGESIAQTNQYIHSRAADAGFTAKSVVLSPEMKGQGKWIDVPKEAYQPIAQGAVILKHGQATNPKLSQQFHDFLHSAKARAIFERYGYALP